MRFLSIILVVILLGCQADVNVNSAGESEVVASTACQAYTVMGQWRDLTFGPLDNQTDILTFTSDCKVHSSYCDWVGYMPEGLDPDFSTWHNFQMTISGSKGFLGCLLDGTHTFDMLRDLDPGLGQRTVVSFDGGPNNAYLTF